MKVILHVGLSKAASTKIQSELDRHSEEIQKRGVWYSKSKQNPGRSYRSSGNGVELYQLLQSLPGNESTFLGRIIKWFHLKGLEAERESCDALLISSELLCNLGQIAWTTLASVQSATGYNFRFVVVQREPYSWLFSSWLQRVKNHGETEWLDRFFYRDIGDPARPLLIANAIGGTTGFEGRLVLVDYDANRENICEAFFAAIGLPDLGGAAPTTKRAVRINRSITKEELALFLEFNRSTGGMPLSFFPDNAIRDDAEDEQFFFCDRSVRDKLYAHLENEGADFRREEFAGQPSISEDEFYASLSKTERKYLRVSREVVGYFHNETERVIGAAVDLAGRCKESDYKPLVPTDFDVVAYLLQNRGVLFANVDPYRHFIEFGQAERRKIHW